MGQRDGRNQLASISGLTLEVDVRTAPVDWSSQLAALGIGFASLEPFGPYVNIKHAYNLPTQLPEWLRRK